MSLLLLLSGSTPQDPFARNLEDGSLRTVESDFKRRLENNVAENLGAGGFALDGQYGSTIGVDANDPLLLTHTGTNYLYVPGVSGNSAITPYIAAYALTGDIEVIMRLSMDSWAVTNDLIWRAGGAFESWGLKTFLGQLNFYWHDGSPTQSILSGSTLPFSAGQTGWVRVTFQPNSAGSRIIRFFTAPDQTTVPVTWTQLGPDRTGAPTTLTQITNAGVAMGGYSVTSSNLAGGLYRAIIRNGVGGTAVLDANFTTGITSGGQTSFTESSSNAATVTIQRPTSGRKSVAVVRPVWLFGTNDFLQVADNALLDFANADDWTLLVVNRVWATPSSGQRFIDKTGPAGVGGYILRAAGTAGAVGGALEFSDGTTSVSCFQSSDRQAGVLDVLFARRQSSTSQVDVGRILNGAVNRFTTSTSTVTGSLANSSPFRVGTNQSAGQGNDFECFAVVAFRRRLSDAELLSIASYYGVTG